MRIRRSAGGFVVLVSLIAGLLGGTVSPAHAAFDGSNGWIPFVSDRDGDDEIYLARPDGTAVIQLTNNTASDRDPSFSPDGTRIAFISDRSGDVEIWMMKADGTAQFQLTTDPVVESHPTWDAIGSQVAFAGFDGTDSEVYKKVLGGPSKTNLSRDPIAWDDNPEWSPGGLRIAFDSTNRDGDPGTNIYTIVNDGTDLLQLTDSGTDSNPNYAPDNLNLVFQSKRDTAPGPSMFGAINQPTGVAVTEDQVLVTQFNNDRVRALDGNGVMTTFAELPPTGNRAAERYIAVSPGLGGFPAGHIYVTVGKDIYEITPDGSTVTLFKNIPQLHDSQTGITFDTVGDFGFKMILTDRTGPIWTVGSLGVANQIADLGRHVQESPVIAPPSFAPYGGQLLIGSKFVDKIYALDPGGFTFSIVGDYDSPKGGNVVPSSVCEFQSSGGAYFLAVRGQNEIWKFPAANFAGLSGDILMPSELTTDIARLHSNGTSVEISQFWGPLGLPDLEGSAFAPCAAGAAPASTQQAGETHDLYKMTSTGTNVVRLTDDDADDTLPVWSPDGLTIGFTTDRDDPNAPGCRETGTCVHELYTMNSNGGDQANMTNNAAADDDMADWQAVGFGPSVVTDFRYTPNQLKPAIGESAMWDFQGPTAHTVTDSSGMGLFDSGIKEPGTFYINLFTVSAAYPYTCTLHPTQMSGSVKVPVKAAPRTGDLTTVFTITWAKFIPPGYRVDVQIRRPGETDFVDWIVDTNTKNFGFVADAGTGTYSFRSRLERVSNLETSDYSAPVSITVNP